jgi:hypothetical protein
MAATLGVTVCGGGCGIARDHKAGFIDPFGVLHWADRKVTRKGARRFLLLVARLRRESDPAHINDYGLYDWWYLARDAVAAQKMAVGCGFRLPGWLFDRDKDLCRALAARRGVKLSKYPLVVKWLAR